MLSYGKNGLPGRNIDTLHARYTNCTPVSPLLEAFRTK
jgi:hypothetical protein